MLAGEDQAIDPTLKLEQKLEQRPIAHYLADPAIPKQAASQQAADSTPVSQSPIPQTPSVQKWLTNWLSQRLKVPSTTIDITRAFADYGIDSVMAVELAQELEESFNLAQPLDVTIAWNFPTIQALANYIKPLAQAQSSQPAQPDDLANLSESELTRLLAEEITLSQNLGRRTP
jgi:acyl carrier protein